MRRLLDWRGHAWFGLGARLYVGAVFLLACYHKILDPAVFAVDVATYQFLPLSTINFFALTVPWMELVVGVMLVVGLRVRPAALIVAGLMASFMIALGWALHLGLDMSCGCFASQAATEEDAISWHTLIRDSVWLLLALYILVFDRRPLGVERLAKQRS